MAEPDKYRRQHIAEVFLPAYNRLHGTSYVNPPEHEEPGKAYDLRWKAPARGSMPLEVQLVRGPLDPIGDRVHPGRVGRLHAAIQAWCDERGLKGFAIWLGHSRPTRQPLSLDAITSFVRDKLEEGLKSSPAPGSTLTLHRPQPHSADPYPKIELTRLPVETRTLVFSTPTPRAYMPQTVPRLRQAIDLKQVKWLHGQSSDLVLLVDFDVDGYHEEDLPELREEVSSGPVLFREVWGVSLWSPGERADRLWP